MINKYSVVYSPAAKDDLFAIRRYIAEKLKAPTTATKLAKRIRDSIKELDTSPERYVRVDESPCDERVATVCDDRQEVGETPDENLEAAVSDCDDFEETEEMSMTM